METPMVKRAITLGGGGPAAGLHIGVLEALAEDKIEFEVWALSCIGAWVGIVYHVYNTLDKNQTRAKLTYKFFRDGVFRDDESYEHFPINRAFAPDFGSNIRALREFVTDPDNYSDFRWQPDKIVEYVRSLLKDKPSVNWSEGDLYRWILNEVMAPNPFIRYLTSMMYLSKVNGLSRINYPNSEFMKSIEFEKLKDLAPHVFHNAWNLDNQQLALFSNHPFKNKNKEYEYVDFIDARTLCACSALPYIEETVEIDKFTYCEGALVDTVNFQSLLEEHGDLEEIWISRIVDSHQIRKPENLVDAQSNLCQLFAATVGEDDVKLFKYHVVERGWKGKVVEIHVPAHINFKWNHSNLGNSRTLGYLAAKQAIAADRAGQGKQVNGVLFINNDPKRDPKWLELRDQYYPHLKRAAEQHEIMSLDRLKEKVRGGLDGR
jgi:predicted acylesterase/phospholipase RssA